MKLESFVAAMEALVMGVFALFLVSMVLGTLWIILSAWLRLF